MSELLEKKPDIFFLTYDEPLKDRYWENFRQLIPWSQRIDGVKGFDAAHKACASAAKSKRFFIVDGDNSLDPTFLKLRVQSRWYFTKAVYSWSGRNSVNGLIYGNGGIKNWSRSTALNMKSHENSETPGMAVDFCFGIVYRQLQQCYSTSDIHQTPFQAFRAGFREGVKMSLHEGERPQLSTPNSSSELLKNLARSNLERLKIWCSVGADVPNGLWSIYGARLGCRYLIDPGWDHQIIHDYDWFNNFWETEIAPQFSGFQKECFVSGFKWSDSKLIQSCRDLEKILKHEIGLETELFSPGESRFFKSVYFNRPRTSVLKLWN